MKFTLKQLTTNEVMEFTNKQDFIEMFESQYEQINEIPDAVKSAILNADESFQDTITQAYQASLTHSFWSNPLMVWNNTFLGDVFDEEKKGSVWVMTEYEV